MIVLGIDASSDAAAAGLAADGRLLCEYTLNNGKNHSVKLLPMIEELLRQTGLSFPDIDVYACGVGPGSFTGVRIGVATAKGFAQSWGKPVAAMSSLQLLAENIRGYSGLRVACVYARAEELYCAAYDAADRVVLPPCVMTLEALLDYLADKQCLLCGDGAQKFSAEILSQREGGIAIADAAAHIIRGGEAAMLGYRLAAGGAAVPCEDVAPVYLRASQAEREYQARHNGQNEKETGGMKQ